MMHDDAFLLMLHFIFSLQVIISLEVVYFRCLVDAIMSLMFLLHYEVRRLDQSQKRLNS